MYLKKVGLKFEAIEDWEEKKNYNGVIIMKESFFFFY